jgi:pimeloyl-ACP methyl ester carboxylesterase
LTKIVDAFTEAIGLKRYAIYVFDYGAPIGFRLALAHPERVTAIISQNGNAYEEGLSQRWNSIQKCWNEPTDANRAALRDRAVYRERNVGCPAILAHAFHLSQFSWKCVFASSNEAVRPSVRTPARASTKVLIDQLHLTFWRPPAGRSS